MYDLTVIGGGAGGLSAAVTAIKRGKKILVLEKANKLGRKILASGNGKCNLGNVCIDEKRYNDGVKNFKNVLETDVKKFFCDMGLATKEIKGGIYPYSESSLSVLDILRKNSVGADICLGENVDEIYEESGIFIVNGRKTRAVLLATGSGANGGTDSGKLYEKFGHTQTAKYPAIVPLKTDMTDIKGLSGLRAKATVKLISNGEVRAEEKGEILFKNDGVGGIACMALSSVIARNPHCKYDISVDFILSDEKELSKMGEKFGATCFLHKAIAQSVASQASARDLSEWQVMRDFIIKNAHLGDFSNAQVVSGGLKTDEFDENFMSKKKKNLYACGEVLDVDGDCGGFNLHFAFSSGIKVGSVC